MSLITTLVIAICCLCIGFVGGCSQRDKAEVRTETKFIAGKEKIVEVEKRVEVPKFIQVTTTIHTESEKLIEAAKNDTPNPDSCDFSPDRLHRLKVAATGNPE